MFLFYDLWQFVFFACRKPRVVVQNVGAARTMVPKELTEYELDEDTMSSWKQLLEEVEQGKVVNNK